ncbi:hypothetical protein ACJX0J_036201, partial [Zea mays]
GRQKLFSNEEKILLNKRVPDLEIATSADFCYFKFSFHVLLKHNVDINALDKDGLPAIHKAILSKKAAIINYLLRNSANPFIQDKKPAAEKTTAEKKPKAEKRVPAGKSAGKEDDESKRGRKKGKKSVETSRPHLSSSKWREWSSSEGDRGGLQLVQQWRSWRAGVGSPGDDGARGWASWRAGVGRPSDDGAPGWSGGGRRAGWAVEEDGARGWAALALTARQGGAEEDGARGGPVEEDGAGVGCSGPQADGPPRKS